MNVEQMAASYERNRNLAVRNAERQNPNFSVGQLARRHYSGNFVRGADGRLYVPVPGGSVVPVAGGRVGRVSPNTRPQAHYSQRMVNTPPVTGAVSGRRRGMRPGHIGQQTSAMAADGRQFVEVYPDANSYPQGYPDNDCPIDVAGSMPTGMGCETQPPCGVNVIGGNTLTTNGIISGAVGNVVITAGDAGYFQPRAIYFEAHGFSSPTLINDGALSGGQQTFPVILQDVLIGRVSMLRRGGAPERGLIQGGFANTKELVAVDWGEFVSTNEQNLTLVFFNLNAAQTIHVFVDIWGNI